MKNRTNKAISCILSMLLLMTSFTVFLTPIASLRKQSSSMSMRRIARADEFFAGNVIAMPENSAPIPENVKANKVTIKLSGKVDGNGVNNPDNEMRLPANTSDESPSPDLIDDYASRKTENKKAEASANKQHAVAKASKDVTEEASAKAIVPFEPFSLRLGDITIKNDDEVILAPGAPTQDDLSQPSQQTSNEESLTVVFGDGKASPQPTPIPTSTTNSTPTPAPTPTPTPTPTQKQIGRASCRERV